MMVDLCQKNDLLFVSCGDHSIKRISSDGTFTTVSGLENNSGLINGLDAILEFDDFKQKNRPSRYNNPNQMQLDNSNNLLIVDTDNNVIRNLEIKPVVNTTYTGIHYIAQEEGTIKKYIPTHKKTKKNIKKLPHQMKLVRFFDFYCYDFFHYDHSTL